MSKRVLCKFFMHGACLKGEYCEYSHDWNDQPNNVCTFYQKGVCSYGSHCRYDHIKITKNQTGSTSSSSSAPHTGSKSSSTNPTGLTSNREYLGSLSNPPQHSIASAVFLPPTIPAWTKSFQEEDCGLKIGDDYAVEEALFSLENVEPADLPICSFAAAGHCPYGDECPRMHGDACPICEKQCLHPYRPSEREEHMKLCEKNHKHLEALKRSQDIECSVCLDRVLSKTTAAERKFGLLSECDHPFCISCIRNWRSNSPSSGMDINSALRACPICRKLSYYVIPSVIWYFSAEEKQEIIDSYKAKLKSIDCKYFDFGNSSCPFGTSCFYKHAYRDGRLEEVVLRHLDADDGSTVIAKSIRLSDFFRELRL